MKIKIERGRKQYEVVPCGRRCSFAKKDGDGEYCDCGCHAPKWWKKLMIERCGGFHTAGEFDGLREIGGAKRSCKGCARLADQTCVFRCDFFRAAEICNNFTPKKIGGAK